MIDSLHASSRFIKKEQKKLARQTVYLSLLSVVTLLVFVFLIVPQVVRLFFSVLDSDTGLEVTDKIPPQPPALSAPPTATSSAMVLLHGYGEANSDVVVILNGSEDATISTSEAGEFSHELLLEDGENEVSLYGKDAAGNESVTTKAYSILVDTEAPTIDLEAPTNDQVIELKKNQLTTVKGKTEPKSKVFVNGRLTLADEEGIFSTTHQLNEGTNEITVRVLDLAGNSTEQKISVTFRL